MENEFVEITSQWQGGRAFKATVQPNIVVEMDTPSDLRTAGSPMELVLMALAGCTGMDVISILEKKRQPPRSLEIRIRGKRTEEHPRIYTEIEVEYIFSGENLTPEAAARAIELSATKYCSVGGMLEKAARISTSFRILPGKEAPHE